MYHLSFYKWTFQNYWHFQNVLKDLHVNNLPSSHEMLQSLWKGCKSERNYLNKFRQSSADSIPASSTYKIIIIFTFYEKTNVCLGSMLGEIVRIANLTCKIIYTSYSHYINAYLWGLPYYLKYESFERSSVCHDMNWAWVRKSVGTVILKDVTLIQKGNIY